MLALQESCGPRGAREGRGHRGTGLQSPVTRVTWSRLLPLSTRALRVCRRGEGPLLGGLP